MPMRLGPKIRSHSLATVNTSSTATAIASCRWITPELIAPTIPYPRRADAARDTATARMPSATNRKCPFGALRPAARVRGADEYRHNDRPVAAHLQWVPPGEKRLLRGSGVQPHWCTQVSA